MNIVFDISIAEPSRQTKTTENPIQNLPVNRIKRLDVKAVMDVLGAMVRHGASLARSVQLTAQWNGILTAGPLYPVTLGDLLAVEGLGLGEFFRAASDVHRRLSDFIHAVVVHRRDEAIIGVGGIGFGRIHGASLSLASPRFGSACSLFTVRATTHAWWFWGAC